MSFKVKKLKEKNIPYKIERLDRFFQGVSKLSDQVNFVHRTIPGEEGLSQIHHSKKKVLFSTPLSIEKASKERIEPECEHFSLCGGCHCQHLPYEREVFYKLEQLKWFYRNWDHPEPKVLKNASRFQYRNRIQLHYDREKKQLGFFSTQSNQIIPAPHCLLPIEPIQKEIEACYKDNTWLKKIPPGSPPSGHLEISWSKKQIHYNWNLDYAYLGFEQVNTELNLKLQLELQKLYDHYSLDHGNFFVLDLFGGEGNLSKALRLNPKCIIDLGKKELENYQELDLFAQDSLEIYKGYHHPKPELLIINPPRSGFKGLGNWTKELKPKFILYMSCDIATMCRDLQELEPNSFEIRELLLIDFFPSTYHFETLCFLQIK